MNQRLNFHTDSADVVGLFVLCVAMRGGLSKVASSVAAHNEILRRRPDLLEVLYHPWPTPMATAVAAAGGRLATGGLGMVRGNSRAVVTTAAAAAATSDLACAIRLSVRSSMVFSVTRSRRPAKRAYTNR